MGDKVNDVCSLRRSDGRCMYADCYSLACEGCSDKDTKKPDMVNAPPHYQLMPGVEVYDVRHSILAKMDDLSVPASQVDDWSRMWEYVTRAWGKNGLEDFKKGRWYLDKLIAKLEEKDK